MSKRARIVKSGKNAGKLAGYGIDGMNYLVTALWPNGETSKMLFKGWFGFESAKVLNDKGATFIKIQPRLAS
jgi:hypothetical protein